MTLGLKYVKLPGFRLFGFTGSYEVTEDWIYPDCGAYPPKRVTVQDHEGRDVVTMEPSGLLIIHRGFVWDGPSGPTYDRKENLEPSAAHDAAYRALRSGAFGYGELYRDTKKAIDELYGELCRQCGMWGWWASVNTWTVKMFGNSSSRPQKEGQLKVHGE